MRTFARAVVGTAIAGAMTLGSVGAAQAQRYDNRDYRDYRERRDRDRTEDVIAGAVIVGGLAALLGSQSRYGYGGYGRSGDPRAAVEQCINAATRQADRYSYGGNAHVTDIRAIDRNRDGYTVKGRIAVNALGRVWRQGDPRYGRGWDNDYRGWNDRYAGYDAGKFSCRTVFGRVVKIDFSGIRGL